MKINLMTIPGSPDSNSFPSAWIRELQLGQGGWPWSEQPSMPPKHDPIQKESLSSSDLKISIITPSFNQGVFLEETIRSVQMQRYPNLEYIVMDGGSTDNSVEIIRKYEPSISHWVSKSDNGQADAIASGFDQSSGEILGFLNSDDLFLPNTLNVVARVFSMNPSIDWIIGDSLEIDEKSQIIRSWRPPHIAFRTLLLAGCWFHQPASFWRRTTYEQVQGFDIGLTFAFDYDLFLRLARIAPPFMVRYPLAAFRVHESAKTSRMADVCEIESKALQVKHGAERYPKLYRRLFRRFFVRYTIWNNRSGK